MNRKKHYLSELPEEEIKKLILYPSEIWQTLYEDCSYDNGEYVSDLADEILGKDYHTWTKYDDCSYTWWLNIKPGYYEHILDITQFDYFSDDDAKRIKELQKKIKAIKDKIGNLDDTIESYDEMTQWEEEADEYADQALQIVVDMLKQAEEVTDEQMVDMFMCNELGDNYYYYDDDKSVVFQDFTKSYKTGA